jgi:hypothetical protein
MEKLLFIISLFLVFSMVALIHADYKKTCWDNPELYTENKETEAWINYTLSSYDYEEAEQDHIEFLKRKRIVDSCLKNNLPIPPGRTILAEFIYNPKYDKK